MPHSYDTRYIQDQISLNDLSLIHEYLITFRLLANLGRCISYIFVMEP